MSWVELPIEQGHEFGPYTIDVELGVGGMASVWKAYRKDFASEVPVVLKMMLPHISRKPEFVAMFIREAMLGAELSHPNLIDVYDVGLLARRYYIEMEYFSGRTLRQVLRRLVQAGRAFALPVALAAMADGCDALAYIHDYRDVDGRPLKLVHRDVSPENLMMGYTGVTKLLDFGVASAEHSSLTTAGERKGKLHYMPPESFRGAPSDKSRDIYAVGATLYELLAGRRPFLGRNDAELMFQIAEGDLVSPRQLRPEVPAELEQLIIKTLARDPRERCHDISELGRDLRAVLARVDDRDSRQIIAEAMATLDVEDTSPDDDGLEDALTTASFVDIIDIQEPEATEEEPWSAIPVLVPDLFSSVEPVPASIPVRPQVDDVFTNPGSTRSTDDLTSSVFTLYSRPGRSEPASPPRFETSPVAPVVTEPEPQDEGSHRDALAHFERGLEYKRTGQLAAALTEWEQAAQLDPTNRTIASNVRMLKRKME